MRSKPISQHFNDFVVERERARCIDCEVCVRQCSYGVHFWDEARKRVEHDSSKCVGCHRCAAMCPTDCLTIRRKPSDFRENALWTPAFIKNIYKQSDTGGVLLSGMGCPSPKPVYWDNMLLDASQVTNPSIDPLREPMELRTFLGGRPDRLVFEETPQGPKLQTEIGPQLQLEYPIMFAAMSFGAINYNLHEAMAKAATELGTFYNTGEGGLHPDLYPYGANTIVQVASGRFGGAQGLPQCGLSGRNQGRAGRKARHRRTSAR